MRRLGVFLSGLAGHPEEARSAGLARLWGRGRRARLPGTTLDQLAARLLGFPLDEGESLPMAALCALADGIAPTGVAVLRVEPGLLIPSQGRMLLTSSTPWPLAAEEADTLLADINGHFAGRGLRLTRGKDPMGWYLPMDFMPDLHTEPFYRVRDTVAVQALPQGRDVRFWNGVANEMQMLLAMHPINRRREGAGLPPVNGVWLWGEGAWPQQRAPCPWNGVWSDSPWLRALGAYGGATTGSAPVDLAGWLAGERSGAHLLHWEEDWRFGGMASRFETERLPALEGVWRSGTPLCMVTAPLDDEGGEVLILRAVDRFRIWRRPRWPALGRSALPVWDPAS